jgi:hypothetical protein
MRMRAGAAVLAAVLLGLVLSGSDPPRCEHQADGLTRPQARPSSVTDPGAPSARVASGFSRPRHRTSTHLATPPERHRGTVAWHLHRPALDRQIEGYADRVSGLPGARVGLRISTTSRWYDVAAYRIGAYRGGSGLRMWASARLRGHRQARPCLSSRRTRTVRAP